VAVSEADHSLKKPESQDSLQQKAEAAAKKTVASEQQKPEVTAQKKAEHDVEPKKAAPIAAQQKAEQESAARKAEVAAQEKVAWEQKQQDQKSMQNEQKLVEQAEVKRAEHHKKPPSELAKAAAEVQAEEVLAKEKAEDQAHTKRGKSVVHEVDGPASAAVNTQNKKSSDQQAVKTASPAPESAKKPNTHKLAADSATVPKKVLKALSKKAERMAEKVAVKEDADTERSVRSGAHFE